MLYQHPIFKNYFCDEEGNIYSNYKSSLSLLKSHINKHGYKYVVLYKDKKAITKKVHIVALECFNNKVYILDNKKGSDLCINHIDGNKLNNNIKNLEITTIRKNSQLGNPANEFGRSVVYDKSGKRLKRYRVQILINGKPQFFGYFLTPEEAYSKSKEVYLELFNEILPEIY